MENKVRIPQLKEEIQSAEQSLLEEYLTMIRGSYSGLEWETRRSLLRYLDDLTGQLESGRVGSSP